VRSGTGQLKHLLVACTFVLWGSVLPAQAEPQLTRTSNVVWRLDKPWFGGLSGIEMSPDGDVMTLISDRGMLATARLQRTDGIIVSVQLLSHRPLLHANGTRMKGAIGDAEGLAIGSDGLAYVSFEFRHRVTELNLQTGRTKFLPRHDDFAEFDTNAGLEALAVHPDGRLFTLAESYVDASGSMPLYAYSNDRWQITHRIPTSGSFLPVGADFDDTGRLYLLERAISPLGLRTQIRRFDLSGGTTPVQTPLTTLAGTFDNLEALGLWTDENGATRLTLISDDNFNAFQTTQIVEYLLTE
jgi:hypothetical protein